MNQILLPVEGDPTKQVGFRVKDGCFQPIEVTTMQSAPLINGNIETVTVTTITKVLQSLNPSGIE